MSSTERRLEIRLQTPNPLFEQWLEGWLQEAERRNAKSQYKLRDALQALRSYPLPLNSGRECAILRGFGSTLCNLLDEELRHYKLANNVNGTTKTTDTATTTAAYEQEVQQVLASSVKKIKIQTKATKTNKINKKTQRALEQQELRERQVIMSPDSFTIWLLVDTQETAGKNKRLLDQTCSRLESLAVQYEVRRLTLGDFMWVARDSDGNELVLPYIIERKRMDDLASSIRDGRFHEQKHRLRQCGIQNVIYLVEDHGNNQHVGLPLESLQQAMTNTQIQSNFIVTHTENHWHTMNYLQLMHKQLERLYKKKVLLSVEKVDLQPCKPTDDMVGLLKFKSLYEDSARNAQLTVREVFVQQLLQLHSLSLERALAIVEQYATPRLLLDAYEKCDNEQEAIHLLASIRCGELQRPIGDKIAKTLYEFYRTDF